MRAAEGGGAPAAQATVRKGSAVEFSWDKPDPARTNALWLVHVGANGERSDVHLLYTTRQGEVLSETSFRFEVQEAGEYRLYFGLVASAEGWCPDAEAGSVTLTFQQGEAPRIVSFEASPEQVEKGAEITLRWTLAGGKPEKVLLDGQSVQGASCKRKPQADPTVYTLTASNAAGSDTREAHAGIHDSHEVVSGFITLWGGEPEPAKPSNLPAARVRLQVLDINGAPLANADCFIDAGTPLPAKTDAHGIVEAVLPKGHAAEAMLNFVDLKLEYKLKLDALDDIDQPTGQRDRLNNLGYFAGYRNSEDAADRNLAWAIEEFQCDFLGRDGVTGVFDDATRKKLLEAHGS